MPHYLNDGTNEPPKLRLYLNTGNLADLPADSLWPGLQGAEAAQRLRQDGFEGVQFDRQCLAVDENSGLPYCGLDRISQPDEADAVFAKHAQAGDSCITLHLGWGTEDDDQVDRLVESVLIASEKRQLPAFVETHRATVTQDLWRTVQITKRFPELRFNADFSHYYCGQEMVYGGMEAKFQFMQPIFERVAFMHGRIAAPGHMQAPIHRPTHQPGDAVAGEADYLSHFKSLWTLAMAGFKKNAPPGAVLIFAPELLSPRHSYARIVTDSDARLREETDRYAEAQRYLAIARDCWSQS